MKRLLAILSMLFVRPKNWLSWVLGVTIAIAMTIIVVPGTPVWTKHRRLHRGSSSELDALSRIEQPPQWTISFWSDLAPVPEAPLYAWRGQAPDTRTIYTEAHDYSHGWPLEWMRQTHCAEKYTTAGGGSSLGFPGESCWIPLPKKTLRPLPIEEIVSFVEDSTGFVAIPKGYDPPKIYCDRRWNGNIIDWATNDAWPWSGDYQWLRFGVLLLDLAIALVIVLGATRLFDLWRTHRSNGWNLKLKEMLLIIAASCAFLGWWQYHVQLQNKEREVIPNEVTRLPAEAYRGPVWLSKLIGNPEYLPSFCSHPIEKMVVTDDISDQKLNALQNLTFLNRVTITNRKDPSRPTGKGPIKALDTAKIVSCLKGFRQLRQINFAHQGIPPEQIPQFFVLKNVVQFNVDSARMSEQNYQRLRQLDSRVR